MHEKGAPACSAPFGIAWVDGYFFLVLVAL